MKKERYNKNNFRESRVFLEDCRFAIKSDSTTMEECPMQDWPQEIRFIPYPPRGTPDELLQWAVGLIGPYLPTSSLEDVRRIVIAKAPSRMHDIGGWGDIEMFNRLHHGMVVNVALGLWTAVVVVELNQEGPTFYHPLDLEMSGLSLEDEEAAVLRETIAEVEERLHLDSQKQYETHYFAVGQAPPNSGLGSSACLGVALAKAVMEIKGLTHKKYEVAMIALIVESVRLGLLTGNQDHGASGYGGILAIEIRKGGFPHFTPVALGLSDGIKRQMEDGTLLVYPGAAGRPVRSSRRHEDVVQSIKQGDEGVIGAIQRIVTTAEQAKQALLAGDWQTYCKLYGENGRCQLSLCDGMVTEEALDIMRFVEDKGAYAKPSGAGGAIGIVVPQGSERAAAIRDRLEREVLSGIPGAMFLPVKVDYEGVSSLSFDSGQVAACLS